MAETAAADRRDEKEHAMDRDTTSSGSDEPTPIDELPDKPSQAEGDMGDDQLSDGS